MRRVVCRASELCCGALILVNSTHPLPSGASCTLTPVLGSEVLLEKRAAALLGECLRTVDLRRRIVPVSGWRRLDEQQKIWDDSMAEHGEAFTRKYVALPGCSEHQTGLAIDLALDTGGEIDFLCPSFPDEGVCARFRHEAVRYGFIERYALGRESVTGIAHEPWHFRYVGTPHAELICQNGLCLEEYAAFLRTGERCVELEGGRMVRVLYLPCAGEETVLELEEDCVQVSGDNDGGFIVTAWRGAK